MPSMKNAFNQIAVIGKYKAPEMRENVLKMAQFLSEQQVNVVVEQNTAQHCAIQGYECLTMDEIASRVDLAVVLGGDGTMLTVCRKLASSDIPLKRLPVRRYCWCLYGRVRWIEAIGDELCLITTNDNIAVGPG